MDHLENLWPLVIYASATIGAVAAMMLISWLLGTRDRGHATDEPYESGMRVSTDARLRVSARFYLVAMFFVIFDLEAVYLVVWALVAREAGWTGYVEALVFMSVLLVALAYLWRIGALDWAPTTRARRR